MPFDEDFDIFFNVDDFATACTVDGNSVNAIFDREWSEVVINNVTYSGVYPTLLGKESDFTGKINTIVVIGSDSYVIWDIQPKDSGLVKVVMREA